MPNDLPNPQEPPTGQTVNLDASLDAAEDLSDLMEDGTVSGAEDDISVEVVPYDEQDDPAPSLDFREAIGQAERQLEEMIQREASLMDQHKRLAADFNNFQKRAQRDIQLAVDQSERRILGEILPVLDNFERGLDATYADVESFRNGVELIRKQFLDALRRLGAEAVPVSVGDPFDALTQEALTTLTNPDLPDGVVAAVYEKGFKLRGGLVRPARVVVNRAPDLS